MSTKVLTTRGREVLAGLFGGLPFVAALSFGDPDWDAAWTQPNPPQPDIDETAILDLIAYARPTIVDFVRPDPDGPIATEEGERYTLSDDRTRFVRVRVSIPSGTLGGVYVREVGLFASPTLADGVPSGRTIFAPGDVLDPGDLCQLVWSPPQFINAGTSYARNFVLRV